MAKANDISEARIRQAIWMVKAKKTKKSVCEHLGIAYNTKRLDAIIQEFHDKQDREAALKKQARKKIFNKVEKQAIADAYMGGEAQSAIAKQYYVSPQRVKNILLEMNVPIRARGKGKAAKVDHIVQDLEVRFKKGDKVFLGDENSFAEVREVYDEDHIDYIEDGKQKYIEIYPFKAGANGRAGKYYEPAQGVHYEIYWMVGNSVLPTWKMDTFLQHRDKVSKVLEETGREAYLIYKQDDYGGYRFVTRDRLFPVKAN